MQVRKRDCSERDSSRRLIKNARSWGTDDDYHIHIKENNMNSVLIDFGENFKLLN